MVDSLRLGRYPLSWSVAVPLAAMGLVWVLGLSEVLTSDLAAVLYPAVLPWYVGVLAASALRNVVFPALGSGVAFWSVAAAVMVAEAVLIGGAFELVRAGIRGLRGDRRGTV